MEKRLYRSKTNKVFAGICGGLGEYFNVDPVLFRLGFVIGILCTGVLPGLVAYVLSMFVVPRQT